MCWLRGGVWLGVGCEQMSKKTFGVTKQNKPHIFEENTARKCLPAFAGAAGPSDNHVFIPSLVAHHRCQPLLSFQASWLPAEK